VRKNAPHWIEMLKKYDLASAGRMPAPGHGAGQSEYAAKSTN